MNVAPFPGSLSTSTAPPAFPAIACTVASPSPVPLPISFVVKNARTGGGARA